MRRTASIVLAAGMATAVAPVADGAGRADLRVTHISATSGPLPPGARLTIRDTVRNAGSRRARASTVAYWLSTDRRRDGADVPVGKRALGSLRARRRASGGRSLTLPSVLRPGQYHVLACADAARKVRERSERNNCRASGGRLTVAPAGAAQPLAPALAAPAQASPAPPDAPAPAATPVPEPSPDPPGPAFPLEPDPLTVAHVKETDRATSAEIIGGLEQTISTTASDGTIYTLRMPAGAVLSPVTVTLTPVSAVEGSPLSNLLGAVEILPHGLQLIEPATLTIDPVGESASTPTGFLSYGDGEDFHLYPVARSEVITMTLTHLSTPGAAEASGAERDAALAHPPIRTRGQMESLVGAALADAAAAGDGLPHARLATLMGAYYEGTLAQLVQDARTNDALAERAVAELTSWGRHVDLYDVAGYEAVEPHRAALYDNLKAIVENAIHASYDRCVTGHQLPVIARMVRLARLSVTAGISISDEALDKALRCVEFEIALDSLVEQDFTSDDAEVLGAWHVVTPERVRLALTNGFYNGQGALKYAAFSYEATFRTPVTDCTRIEQRVSVSAQPDTEVAFSLRFDGNLWEAGVELPPDLGLRVMVFLYEELVETYHDTTPEPCSGSSDDEQVTGTTWQDEFHTPNQRYEFTGWTLENGELLATKLHKDSFQPLGMTETTKLEIWHTPR